GHSRVPSPPDRITGMIGETSLAAIRPYLEENSHTMPRARCATGFPRFGQWRNEQDMDGGISVRSESLSLRLADGRRLGYAEYGAPDGDPVFLFHGTPCSRLMFR